MKHYDKYSCLLLLVLVSPSSHFRRPLDLCFGSNIEIAYLFLVLLHLLKLALKTSYQPLTDSNVPPAVLLSMQLDLLLPVFDARLDRTQHEVDRPKENQG
jgi:hypothetical protein